MIGKVGDTAKGSLQGISVELGDVIENLGQGIHFVICEPLFFSGGWPFKVSGKYAFGSIEIQDRWACYLSA